MTKKNCIIQRSVEKVTGDLYEEGEDDNRGRRNFRINTKKK